MFIGAHTLLDSNRTVYPYSKIVLSEYPYSKIVLAEYPYSKIVLSEYFTLK